MSKQEFSEYRVVVTDTYGGEANFSWAREHKIKARSWERAVRKALRTDGYKPGVMGPNYCKAVKACVIALCDE